MAGVLKQHDRHLLKHHPTQVFAQLVSVDWWPSGIDKDTVYYRYCDDDPNRVEISFPNDNEVRLTLDPAMFELPGARFRVPFIGGGNSGRTKLAFMYLAWLIMQQRYSFGPNAAYQYELNLQQVKPTRKQGALDTLIRKLLELPNWPSELTHDAYTAYDMIDPGADWEANHNRCIKVMHSCDGDTWLSSFCAPDIWTPAQLHFKWDEQPLLCRALVFCALAMKLDEAEYHQWHQHERRAELDTEKADYLRDKAEYEAEQAALAKAPL